MEIRAAARIVEMSVLMAKYKNKRFMKLEQRLYGRKM